MKATFLIQYQAFVNPALNFLDANLVINWDVYNEIMAIYILYIKLI